MRAQLIAALEESLRQAPEPDEILREVRARIRRRRQRRRWALVCASLGTVVLVLAVSLTVLPVRTPIQPAMPDLTVTLAPDWVPAGMERSYVGNGAGGDRLMYRGSGASLFIALDTYFLTRSLDEPGWDRVEINGSTGRIRNDEAGALLEFPSPSGRWVDIRYSAGPPGGRLSAAELRAGAIRVAESMRWDVRIPVRVGFAPGYLPESMGVVAVLARLEDAGQGVLRCAAGWQPGATSRGDGDGGQQALPLGPGVEITVELGAIETVAAPRNQRADINGRPAIAANSGRTILVLDFHGTILRVDATYDGRDPSPTDPVPSEAELVKVAENVYWFD